ncbi:MAG: alanine--tRNA ligase [Planctomycetota bacterium]|nr:alanine--tRNA ligase [Planctomycetota bacterium]
MRTSGPPTRRAWAPTAPCGPCSEIYYDTHPAWDSPLPSREGAGGGRDVPPPAPVADDELRYCEVGNLVFTQYDRRDAGKLEPLPSKNIDTGSGLERAARLIQGKPNNYEIDLLFPIVEHAAKLAGKPYGKNFEDDRRMRRIADHVRFAVFAIHDGVPPRNEGRNYVVRRLIRRAILDGRELGIEQLFMPEIAEAVIAKMKVGYPHLEKRAETIVRTIAEEEKSFDRTLAQGRQHLEEILAGLKQKKGATISGADAFRLWDTFGFPIELTVELAEHAKVVVDLPSFEAEMEKARERSRAGSEIQTEIFKTGPLAELAKRYAGQPTEFVGYEQLEIDDAEVLAIVQNEKLVDRAFTGKAVVLLDATPFYAESGGQVGDRGTLTTLGTRAAVNDTQKLEGLVLHHVEIPYGSLEVGDRAAAVVAPSHRLPALKNHSATHLLHLALREALGDHVEQRGSLVAPDRLRFDFAHFEALTPEELAKIEARVNELIQADHPVETRVTSLQEAKSAGAMALFGEKYGERVRMVGMGPSKELCGGTHCARTGEIGYFRLVAESSVAAGVRRVEALTGAGAVADARKADESLQRLAGALRARREEVLDRLKALQDERAALERELSAARKKAASAQAGSMLENVKEVAGAKLLAAQVDGADAPALRGTLDGLRKSLPEAAVVLGGVKDGKVALLVSLSKELVGRGAHAGNLLRDLAGIVGGKGGGKPDMAQGGGKDPEKLPEALAAAEGLLAKMLGQS